MYRYFTSAITTFAVVIALLPAPTHALTMNEALKRMDDIIAEMNALRTEFASLVVSVGPTTGTPTTVNVGSVLGAATSCTDVLVGSLEAGDTSDAIAKVQRLLASDPAIYEYGVDSGFYGPKTTEAIRNLQSRFGLDPVGVIGPATEALLKAIMCVYPSENYPANVLDKKPTVADIQPTTSAVTPTPLPAPSVSNNPIKSIDAEFDRGEAEVSIVYYEKNTQHMLVSGDDEEEIAESIARRTGDKIADILAVLELEDVDDEDKQDAKDAIEEAEDAINDAEDEVEEAEEDGDDVDWAEDTLKDAEDSLEEAEDAYDEGDYDDAKDYAEEAEDLANDAIDRIDEVEGGDEDEAKEAIEDAEKAIEDAADEIDEADADDEEVDWAKDTLEEAEELLEEAEEAFDDEDYDEAIELAEEAEELAEEAIDRIGKDE